MVTKIWCLYTVITKSEHVNFFGGCVVHESSHVLTWNSVSVCPFSQSS
jgi:hypothetical protein